MKINICPICVVVSLLWLGMSAGIAWGYLDHSEYSVPVALLMGGTVVGIAYRGERVCRWAAKNNLLWKSLVIGGGLPVAYLLISHLSKFVVGVEVMIMLTVAYFLFIKRTDGKPSDDTTIRDIEEQMKQCC